MKKLKPTKAWILLCSVIVVSNVVTEHTSHYVLPHDGDITSKKHQNTAVPYTRQMPEEVMSKQELSCISADTNIFEIMRKAKKSCKGTDMICTFYLFTNRKYYKIGALEINKHLLDNLLLKYDNWLLTAEKNGAKNIEKHLPGKIKRNHKTKGEHVNKIDTLHAKNKGHDNSANDDSLSTSCELKNGLYIDDFDHGIYNYNDINATNITDESDYSDQDTQPAVNYSQTHREKEYSVRIVNTEEKQGQNGNYIKLDPHYNKKNNYFEVFLPKDKGQGEPGTINVNLMLNENKPHQVKSEELLTISDNANTLENKRHTDLSGASTPEYEHEVEDQNINSKHRDESYRNTFQVTTKTLKDEESNQIPTQISTYLYTEDPESEMSSDTDSMNHNIQNNNHDENLKKTDFPISQTIETNTIAPPVTNNDHHYTINDIDVSNFENIYAELTPQEIIGINNLRNLYQHHINPDMPEDNIATINGWLETKHKQNFYVEDEIQNNDKLYAFDSKISKYNGDQKIILDDTTGKDKNIINYAKNYVVPGKYANHEQYFEESDFNYDSDTKIPRLDKITYTLEETPDNVQNTRTNNELNTIIINTVYDNQNDINEEIPLNAEMENEKNIVQKPIFKKLINSSAKIIDRLDKSEDKENADTVRRRYENPNIYHEHDFDNTHHLLVHSDDNHTSSHIYINEPVFKHENPDIDHKLELIPYDTEISKTSSNTKISDYKDPMIDQIFSQSQPLDAVANDYFSVSSVPIEPHDTLSLTKKELPKPIIELDSSSFLLLADTTPVLDTSLSENSSLDSLGQAPLVPNSFQLTSSILPIPPMESIMVLKKGSTTSPLNMGFSWLPSFHRIEELRLPSTTKSPPSDPVISQLDSDLTLPSLSTICIPEANTLESASPVQSISPADTDLFQNGPPPNNQKIFEMNSPEYRPPPKLELLSNLETATGIQQNENPLRIISFKPTVGGNLLNPIGQYPQTLFPLEAHLLDSPFDISSSKLTPFYKDLNIPPLASSNKGPCIKTSTSTSPILNFSLLPSYLDENNIHYPTIKCSPSVKPICHPKLPSVLETLFKPYSKIHHLLENSNFIQNEPIHTFQPSLSNINPKNETPSFANIVSLDKDIQDYLSTVDFENLNSEYELQQEHILEPLLAKPISFLDVTHPYIDRNVVKNPASRQKPIFIKSLPTDLIPPSIFNEDLTALISEQNILQKTTSNAIQFLEKKVPVTPTNAFEPTLETDFSFIPNNRVSSLSKIQLLNPVEVTPQQSENLFGNQPSTLELDNSLIGQSIFSSTPTLTYPLTEDKNQSVKEKLLYDCTDFVPLDATLIGPELESSALPRNSDNSSPIPNTKLYKILSSVTQDNIQYNDVGYTTALGETHFDLIPPSLSNIGLKSKTILPSRLIPPLLHDIAVPSQKPSRLIPPSLNDITVPLQELKPYTNSKASIPQNLELNIDFGKPTLDTNIIPGTSLQRLPSSLLPFTSVPSVPISEVSIDNVSPLLNIPQVKSHTLPSFEVLTDPQFNDLISIHNSESFIPEPYKIKLPISKLSPFSPIQSFDDFIVSQSNLKSLPSLDTRPYNSYLPSSYVNLLDMTQKSSPITISGSGIPLDVESLLSIPSLITSTTYPQPVIQQRPLISIPQYEIQSSSYEDLLASLSANTSPILNTIPESTKQYLKPPLFKTIPQCFPPICHPMLYPNVHSVPQYNIPITTSLISSIKKPQIYPQPEFVEPSDELSSLLDSTGLQSLTSSNPQMNIPMHLPESTELLNLPSSVPIKESIPSPDQIKELLIKEFDENERTYPKISPHESEVPLDIDFQTIISNLPPFTNHPYSTVQIPEPNILSPHYKNALINDYFSKIVPGSPKIPSVPLLSPCPARQLLHPIWQVPQSPLSQNNLQPLPGVKPDLFVDAEVISDNLFSIPTLPSSSENFKTFLDIIPESGPCPSSLFPNIYQSTFLKPSSKTSAVLPPSRVRYSPSGIASLDKYIPTLPKASVPLNLDSTICNSENKPICLDNITPLLDKNSFELLKVISTLPLIKSSPIPTNSAQDKLVPYKDAGLHFEEFIPQISNPLLYIDCSVPNIEGISPLKYADISKVTRPGSLHPFNPNYPKIISESSTSSFLKPISSSISPNTPLYEILDSSLIDTILPTVDTTKLFTNAQFSKMPSYSYTNLPFDYNFLQNRPPQLHQNSFPNIPYIQLPVTPSVLETLDSNIAPSPAYIRPQLDFSSLQSIAYQLQRPSRLLIPKNSLQFSQLPIYTCIPPDIQSSHIIEPVSFNILDNSVSPFVPTQRTFSADAELKKISDSIQPNSLSLPENNILSPMLTNTLENIDFFKYVPQIVKKPATFIPQYKTLQSTPCSSISLDADSFQISPISLLLKQLHKPRAILGSLPVYSKPLQENITPIEPELHEVPNIPHMQPHKYYTGYLPKNLQVSSMPCFESPSVATSAFLDKNLQMPEGEREFDVRDLTPKYMSQLADAFTNLILPASPSPLLPSTPISTAKTKSPIQGYLRPQSMSPLLASSSKINANALPREEVIIWSNIKRSNLPLTSGSPIYDYQKEIFITDNNEIDYLSKKLISEASPEYPSTIVSVQNTVPYPDQYLLQKENLPLPSYAQSTLPQPTLFLSSPFIKPLLPVTPAFIQPCFPPSTALKLESPITLDMSFMPTSKGCLPVNKGSILTYPGYLIPATGFLGAHTYKNPSVTSELLTSNFPPYFMQPSFANTASNNNLVVAGSTDPNTLQPMSSPTSLYTLPLSQSVSSIITPSSLAATKSSPLQNIRKHILPSLASESIPIGQTIYPKKVSQPKPQFCKSIPLSSFNLLENIQRSQTTSCNSPNIPLSGVPMHSSSIFPLPSYFKPRYLDLPAKLTPPIPLSVLEPLDISQDTFYPKSYPQIIPSESLCSSPLLKTLKYSALTQKPPVPIFLAHKPLSILDSQTPTTYIIPSLLPPSSPFLKSPLLRPLLSTSQNPVPLTSAHYSEIAPSKKKPLNSNYKEYATPSSQGNTKSLDTEDPQSMYSMPSLTAPYSSLKSPLTIKYATVPRTQSDSRNIPVESQLSSLFIDPISVTLPSSTKTSEDTGVSQSPIFLPSSSLTIPQYSTTQPAASLQWQSFGPIAANRSPTQLPTYPPIKGNINQSGKPIYFSLISSPEASLPPELLLSKPSQLSQIYPSFIPKYVNLKHPGSTFPFLNVPPLLHTETKVVDGADFIPTSLITCKPVIPSISVDTPQMQYFPIEKLPYLTEAPSITPINRFHQSDVLLSTKTPTPLPATPASQLSNQHWTSKQSKLISNLLPMSSIPSLLTGQPDPTKSKNGLQSTNITDPLFQEQSIEIMPQEEDSTQNYCHNYRPYIIPQNIMKMSETYNIPGDVQSPLPEVPLEFNSVKLFTPADPTEMKFQVHKPEYAKEDYFKKVNPYDYKPATYVSALENLSLGDTTPQNSHAQSFIKKQSEYLKDISAKIPASANFNNPQNQFDRNAYQLQDDSFYANNHVGKRTLVNNEALPKTYNYNNLPSDSVQGISAIPIKRFRSVAKLDASPLRPNDYSVISNVPTKPNMYPQKFSDTSYEFSPQKRLPLNRIQFYETPKDATDAFDSLSNTPYGNFENIKYSGYKAYSAPTRKITDIYTRQQENYGSVKIPQSTPSIAQYQKPITNLPVQIIEPIPTELDLNALQQSPKSNEYYPVEVSQVFEDNIKVDSELKSCIVNYINSKEEAKNNLDNNNGELTIPLGNLAIIKKEPHDFETINTKNPSVGLKVWKSKVKIVEAEVKLKIRELSVNNFMPIVNNLDEYDIEEVRNIVKNYIDEKYGNHIELKEPYTVDNQYTVLNDFDHNAVENNFNLLWPANYV